jgi:hypothetical protein
MAAIKSTKVPKAFGETYAVITTITDIFCREHLNEEYGELARFATAALCRKRPSPLSRGKPKTWACGILYALGQVNFLPDKSFEPHMSLGELCELMGVGKSTGPVKAKVISEALDLYQFHPDWTLPSMLEHNPFAWFIEINGVRADARSLPLEIQEAAVQEGLIPYVPGGEERSILVERYLHLRKISTYHQTVLARRTVENTAADIAVRIGLVRDAGMVPSMDLRDLAPALDIALFSKEADGTSLADRYLKEVGGRLKRDHLAVVEAMADARFSVFQLIERHPVAGVVVLDLSTGEEVWLMDQGFEASVPSGYLLALRLIQPAEFHMSTGVVVSMNDEATWETANRRHPLKSTDDLLVISDRDRLAEAVYAAAVETGALVGAV